MYNEIPRLPDTVDGRRRALGFRTAAELNAYMLGQLYDESYAPMRESAPDSVRRHRLSAEELWDVKGLQQEIAIQTDSKVRYDVAVTVPATLDSVGVGGAVERHAEAPELRLPNPDVLSKVGLTELVRMEREVGTFLHTIQSEATKAMRQAHVEYTPGIIDQLTDSRLARRQLEYVGNPHNQPGRATEAYQLSNPYGAPPGYANTLDSVGWAERMTQKVEGRLRNRFRDRVDLYSEEHERQTRYIDYVRGQVEKRRSLHNEVERLLGEQHKGGYLNKPWLDALSDLQGTWKASMPLDMMMDPNDPRLQPQPAPTPSTEPTPTPTPTPTPGNPQQPTAVPVAAPTPPATPAAPAVKTLDQYVADAISSGEWKESTDPKTQKKYYVNKAKKTVWDLKKELTPEYEKYVAAAKVPAAGAGGKATPTPPTPAPSGKTLQPPQPQSAQQGNQQPPKSPRANTDPTAKPTTTTTAPAATAPPPKVPATLDEYIAAAITSGEWKECTDPKTSKKYYVNKAKKTVWDLKKELTPEYEKLKAGSTK